MMKIKNWSRGSAIFLGITTFQSNRTNLGLENQPGIQVQQSAQNVLLPNNLNPKALLQTNTERTTQIRFLQKKKKGVKKPQELQNADIARPDFEE